MELTEKEKLIMQGKVCPYCDQDSAFVSSVEIYGKDYGMAYWCKPCDAYVGCHKGTDNALGRLANKELRGWKIVTHEYFDKLWKGGQMKRAEAYQWLSESLGLPAEYTHIGMFSVRTCKKVIELSKQKAPKFYPLPT